ncbi:MAG: ABC transporter ATP-binding protein/permease [Oscillospiraceae bacterium]|nr:ABC transporter ATP-binding protein/permease [Oscillospiraceae bacterium]
MEKQEKKTRKRGTLSWVLEFAGNRKSSYIGSVILAVLSVLCGFIPYVFMANIVRGLLERTADFSYCLTQCLWMGVFFVLDRLFHAASTTLSHKATFEVLANIRRRLTKKLSRMPLGDVLEESSGTYKNIIVERVDSVETTLAHMIPEVTSNLIIPFVIFAYMLQIDWRLALLSLITVPAGGVFFMLMMVGSQESYQNTVVKTKALNDTAVEYIGGIEVIKAFGKARTSYEKFVVAAKEGADCFIEWMRRCNIYQNLALVLMPATLLALLPFGVSYYMNASVTAPDLLMLIILSLGLITPFVVAASYMDDITKMGTIIGEVTDILEKSELVRPDSMSEQPCGSDVVLKDVHFAYKNDEVLHGISLTIRKGTVNALVGPSGSGKSTIAKLIASFWDVGSGAITFGGVDIRKIPLDDYQKQVAYVSQDNYLFDMSVMENIRLGNPDASDEQVMEAAKACGCHDFIMGLEKGYQTVCGGSGSHLSGGERQRISIARAMLKNAPIVILDEATAYTDPENEAMVQRSVAKLVRGRTLLVIAHRLSTIASADQIILVNDGHVEAAGTQEELLEKSALYRRMWQAHISAKEEESIV